MAQQAFLRTYSTPEITLQEWAKVLNHILNNLDNGSYVAIDPNTIKASMIDFGLGTDEVDAGDIPTADAGGYYSSSTVEGNLQEAGAITKDPTIVALAGLDTTKGIVTQTGTDAFTKRTITGTANQVSVANGTGESGNPTLSLPQDIHTAANPTFNNITGAGLVKGATGHFGGATHYSQFEGDGTLRFNGDATVWKDIDFPIIIRTTGAGIPSLATIQGNISAPQWQVDDFNVCEGQEFVHEWKEGSEVRWHVHMLTNGLDATDRYVKWEVEWFWVNPDGQISASDTQSYEFTIPANTPDKTMFIIPIYQWTPANGKIGGHCYARLKRIASAGTAPTGNPWCTMLQLHIECDTAGSREYMTK